MTRQPRKQTSIKRPQRFRNNYLSFNVTEGDSVEDFINEKLVGYSLEIEYSAYNFTTFESFYNTWDFMDPVKEERKITKDMIKGLNGKETFDITESYVEFYVVVENDTGCNVTDNPNYVTPEPIRVTVTVMRKGTMGA